MSRIVDEYGRPKFDLEEFDIALRRLNEIMEERDIEPFEIYGVGGYVCLLKGKREFTHDIDAYYNASNPLHKAIYDVSQEVRNPEWLNNSIQTHRDLDGTSNAPSLQDLLSFNDTFEVVNKMSRITVFAASAPTVIYMKLIAFRFERPDKTDLEDIADLASDYSIEYLIDVIFNFRSILRIKSDIEDCLFNLLMALYTANAINDNEYQKYTEVILSKVS